MISEVGVALRNGRIKRMALGKVAHVGRGLLRVQLEHGKDLDQMVPDELGPLPFFRIKAHSVPTLSCASYYNHHSHIISGSLGEILSSLGNTSTDSPKFRMIPVIPCLEVRMNKNLPYSLCK